MLLKFQIKQSYSVAMNGSVNGADKSLKLKNMKTSELRIGNHLNLEGKKVVVSGIINKSYLSLDFEYGSTNIDSIKPIELTKELLLKFGFVLSGNRYDYQGFCFFWDKSNGVFLLSDPKPKYRIKYVHQLQNWFYAITGDELVLN